jgi:hypothetical protein
VQGEVSDQVVADVVLGTTDSGEGQSTGRSPEDDVEELEADPYFGGVCCSSEVEPLGPGRHADGDVGETALGLGCDIVFIDKLFTRGCVLLGKGKVVAQPGDVVVCACAGECFRDAALDMSDPQVVFLQAAQELVAR